MPPYLHMKSGEKLFRKYHCLNRLRKQANDTTKVDLRSKYMNKLKAYECFFLHIYKKEGSGHYAFYKNAGLRQ